MDDLSKEIEKYLTVCRDAKGLSQLTLKAYKIDLRQFCEYMLLHDCLSKNELTEYIDYLHKWYKPKSVKRKVACIKAFYRYMEMENIIDDNPFHKIQIKYKMPLLLPKTIPLHYIEAILSYAYRLMKTAVTPYQKEIALRNVAVLELLFSTGMRVSEVSNLKMCNLDLKNKTIRIVGKGSKERIMCITNDDIVHILESYIERSNFDSEYVFRNRLNHHLSEQSIRNMVNDYAKSSNVPMHITPHMFRHTFATALLDENVDIRYIQQLLGHSSIVTTQIYTHISTNKLRNILEERHPRNKLSIVSNIL